MNQRLLGGTKFAKLAQTIAEDYGTVEDDKLETNEKLESFINQMGSANYYTCTILLVLDPNEEFDSMRSYLKMFLLPCFQILVPFGMVWYFLVKENLFTTNGYCCNHDDIIFRFTGFVTFMYSSWQIIDGCEDKSSKHFLVKSVEAWSRTGRSEDFLTTLLFYAGYASQQVCCILLLIVTYVIYTSQCDTPLDLLMNCVAINFVLDIDSEWMNDTLQQRGVASAAWVFKSWRDVCVEDAAEVKRSIDKMQGLRKAAPSLITFICMFGTSVITIVAYVLPIVWSWCPAQY